MRAPRLLPACLVLAAGLGGAALAGAQQGAAGEGADDADRAKVHFQAGVLHYEEGDYDKAIEQFEASYRLSGKPDLLYNIARCHDRLGNPERTLEYLRRYLREQPYPEDRVQVERWIEDLDEEVERRARRGRLRDPGDLGEQDEVFAVRAHEGRPDRFYTWVAAGVAGGLLVGAGAAVWSAKSTFDGLPDACGADGCDRREVEPVRSRLLLSNLMFGLSAAATVATGVLWWWEGREPEPEWEYAVGPGGAGLRGRF